MAKNKVKLNESQIRKMVAESLKQVLSEEYNYQIVTDALRALYSVQDKVNKAIEIVTYNGGDREVAHTLKQIGKLINTLKEIAWD